MIVEHQGVQYAAEQYGRNDFEDEVEIRDLLWRPRAGEVVLDVGSAIGSYTIPALAHGAKVVAFAGQHEHAELLKQNVAMNPGFVDRISILPFGLYDADGWLDCDGRSYAYVDKKPDPWKSEDLEVRRLDGLRIGMAADRLDWIKIDVEGAEVKVLTGATETLKKYRPFVLVENHLFMDPTLEDRVIEFMRSLDVGYRVAAIYRSPAVSHTLFVMPK